MLTRIHGCNKTINIEVQRSNAGGGASRMGVVLRCGFLSRILIWKSWQLCTPLTATVLPPLNVMLNGSGSTPTKGQNYTLTCTTSGGGSMAYTYMWLKDGTVVSGQTSSTYSFFPLNVTDPGRYNCRVRVGSTTMNTSREVTITVVGELCTGQLYSQTLHKYIFKLHCL